MKKLTKKILSFIAIFALVLTSFAYMPTKIKAEAEEEEETEEVEEVTVPEVTVSEDLTTVHIVKVKVKDNTKFNTSEHDGKQIAEGKLAEKFGAGYSLIPGVVFKYWKVDDATKFKAMMDNSANFDTEAKVKAHLSNLEGKELEPTNNHGEVSVKLENGQNENSYNYWFIELKKPVGYEDAKAVPFGLTLPVNNADGQIEDLYIYPKNTVKEPFDPTTPVDPTNPVGPQNPPSLRKTVINDSSTQGTVDFDEEHTWRISARVPENATSLQKLEFREKMDSRIEYKTNSTVVKVGETTLVKDTDYTLTEPSNTNRLFSVNFKPAGIAKLTDKTKDITIEYTATLSKDTVIGAAIYNGIQVVFGKTPNGDHYSEIPPVPPTDPKQPHGPKPFPPTTPTVPGQPVVPGTNPPEPITPPTTITPPPTTPPTLGHSPEIHFGGKVFVKKDTTITSGEQTLQGAEFAVVKEESSELYLLTEENSKYKWKKLEGVSKTSGNTKIKDKIQEVAEAQVKKLTSDNSGNFEIKGLKFGSYALVELKAPAGYGLPTNVVNFEVNATSYYKTYTEITAASPANADRQDVINKKYTIPQTGGIGTVIFIVAGIALMGTALFFVTRKSKKA